MSEHKATIEWKLGDGSDFLKGKFSREHTWTFDGGLTVAASASPSVVPAPWSSHAGIDPEEAFVASISSCHMLSFLYLAYRKGFAVQSYQDHAVGVLAKNDKGSMWVSAVTLRPQIAYAGEKHPTPEESARLHHEAHEICFIANSIKTTVTVNAP